MIREILTGKHKKVFTYVVVGIAIMAALGAGMGLRAWQHHKAAQNGPEAPVDKLSTETKTAQDLAVSGKADDAKKYISNELGKSNLTATQKYDLYIQQGVLARQDNKNQEALENFKKAESFKATREISSLIAETAYMLGDKPTAITYWKKELTQLEKGTALYDADKETLEKQVRDAGGSL